MTPQTDQRPDPRPEGVLFVEDREAQPVLSVRATIRIDEIAQKHGESLRELWSSMQARGVAAAGPPFVRYHTFGKTETDVEVGIPVADPTAGEGRIAAGELPGGAAISTWHFGAHDRLGEAYARLEAWLKERGRQPAGAAWEVYWWIDPSADPDPASWPPPEEWRAELLQPVASMGGAP
jgi:effector-binding domain-containing protein